jgi:hydroxyacylglutathione hydrolase
MLIKPSQRLVLIAESLQSIQEARTRLIRVGLGRVIGYSLADETEWRHEAIDLAHISIQRCAYVSEILKSGPSVQLVDVRSRAEWLTGCLPGAIFVPLLDLDSGARFIDPSRPSLAYCRTGYCATTAASILRRNGCADLGILIDGIDGWLALGLQLEIPASGELSKRPV